MLHSNTGIINRSISTGDPEVGGCVQIDTNIFSRMILVLA